MDFIFNVMEYNTRSDRCLVKLAQANMAQ